MLVTCVMVWVKPEFVDRFIEETVNNHENSVKEPGNLRFDVLRVKDEPSRFILYEAYENAEAAAAHKQTQHYLAWRKTVADWMAQPREGIGCKVVAPTELSGWK